MPESCPAVRNSLTSSEIGEHGQGMDGGSGRYRVSFMNGVRLAAPRLTLCYDRFR